MKYAKFESYSKNYTYLQGTEYKEKPKAQIEKKSEGVNTKFKHYDYIILNPLSICVMHASLHSDTRRQGKSIQTA